MNKTTKGISLAATMLAIVGMMSYAPVSATEEFEGCTPGFWKANEKKGADKWPAPFTPDELLVDHGVVNDGEFDISSLTFSEALKLRGGDSLAEKEEILLRHGAAAILNAAHPEVEYQHNLGSTIALLNDALGEDFDAIQDQIDDFERHNEEGCSLNNSGKIVQ